MRTKLLPREEVPEFPRLRRLRDAGEIDVIVLFKAPGRGTVVHSTGSIADRHEVGSWIENWRDDSFKDFDGIVTLDNGAL